MSQNIFQTDLGPDTASGRAFEVNFLIGTFVSWGYDGEAGVTAILDGVYGDVAAALVRHVQDIVEVEQTGILDAATIEAIARDMEFDFRRIPAPTEG